MKSGGVGDPPFEVHGLEARATVEEACRMRTFVGYHALLMFRTLRDWFDGQRLHHYPALARFERAAALERLRIYRAEERARLGAWPWVAVGGVLLVWVMLAVLNALGAVRLSAMWTVNVPLLALGWLLYVVHRLVKRRVDAKVAAELSGSRLLTCLDCGYDLRASPDRCPECGAPARVETL